MLKFTHFVFLSALTLRQCEAGCIKTMNNKVFVYGTLKRNEPNHTWLTDPGNGVAKFIGIAKTKNKYPLVIATKYNIPFLLYQAGHGHNVVGEVYDVDDLMLSKLDILEDHPKYYVREIDDIEVKAECGTETLKCWVYFLKSFRKSMLSMPMMADYSSTGPHGLRYTERSSRDPNYNYRDEVRD